MSNKTFTNLLIDDYPILVLPKLATKVGLNEAIVLQQMHYWLRENKKNNRNYHEGYYWTYNSYEGWVESFPFWSSRTIRRAITSLEKLGLLLSDNFNKMKRDRTKWYTIDYVKVNELQLEDFDANCKETVQNVQMQKDNLSKPLPETTTDINTNTFTSNVADEESPTFSDESTSKISLFKLEFYARFNQPYRKTKRTSFNNEIIKDLDINEFPIYVRMFFDEMDNDINKCTIEYMDKAINRLIR
jgi:hypothetical protein